MGRAPKCKKCDATVRVLAVMKEGKVDETREARLCPKCGFLDKRKKIRRPRITQ